MGTPSAHAGGAGSRPGPGVRAALALALLALAGAAGAQADGEAGPGALRFDKLAHAFGPVGQHEEHEAVFRYRNVGERTARSIRALGDCGCYSVAVTHEAVAPGEEGAVRVRFRTLAFSGRVVKTVDLRYHDGQPRRAELALELDVVAGVVVSPGRVHFGEVLEGTRPEPEEVLVMWHAGEGRPFEIEEVEIPDLPVAASVGPWEGKPGKPWKGWRIRFRWKEPPSSGVVTGEALVATTHPDHPRVPVPISARVVGKVWVQQSRLNLNFVPQGTRRRATLLFRPFDATIDLGAVSARARKGILETAIAERANRGPTPLYALVVTVPPDAPPGPLDDVIELRTEVPGYEVTEIGVIGRVIERTRPAGGGR